jgi:hypothetical protein
MKRIVKGRRHPTNFAGFAGEDLTPHGAIDSCAGAGRSTPATGESIP